MSEAHRHAAHKCESCGINTAGMKAATFNCPICGTQISRCATCRKQSNLYECPDCGFRGP
jgi:Predicted Zn-ribbon RNA-binding protein with a function in translation